MHQLDDINKLFKSSVCEHAEVEYHYDYEDGIPFVESAICVDCNKDITDTLSDSELAVLAEDEYAYQKQEQADSLRESYYGG